MRWKTTQNDNSNMLLSTFIGRSCIGAPIDDSRYSNAPMSLYARKLHSKDNTVLLKNQSITRVYA